jgi:hypothetical protein
LGEDKVFRGVTHRFSLLQKATYGAWSGRSYRRHDGSLFVSDDGSCFI